MKLDPKLGYLFREGSFKNSSKGSAASTKDGTPEVRQESNQQNISVRGG